jgi:hypothetical protein
MIEDQVVNSEKRLEKRNTPNKKGKKYKNKIKKSYV